VNREILQENRILANIKQASVKKILGAIKKLKEEDFNIFVEQYNKLIKEGIYTDHLNKETLLEIVRYKSSAVEGLTSLDDYIKREEGKKERKKEIYYIIGDDEKVLRNSPLLEAYKKNDLEVLIMDDKEIDEIVTPAIGEYKEWKLVDVSMVEPPSVQENKEELEELTKEYENLIKVIKDTLGDKVKDVKITTRLEESPSCVVPDSSDPMVSMRHLFVQMGQKEPELPLILELNGKHELIKKLKDSTDLDLIKDSAWVLLDSAKLAEGLEPTDKVEFSKRVAKLLEKAV